MKIEATLNGDPLTIMLCVGSWAGAGPTSSLGFTKSYAFQISHATIEVHLENSRFCTLEIVIKR